MRHFDPEYEQPLDQTLHRLRPTSWTGTMLTVSAFLHRMDLIDLRSQLERSLKYIKWSKDKARTKNNPEFRALRWNATQDALAARSALRQLRKTLTS